MANWQQGKDQQDDPNYASKSGGEKSSQKDYVQPVDQLQPLHVLSVVGTATSELVFAATKDAAQWVQIYGLSRPTDANDDEPTISKMASTMHYFNLLIHNIVKQADSVTLHEKSMQSTVMKQPMRLI